MLARFDPQVERSGHGMRDPNLPKDQAITGSPSRPAR